MRESRAIIRNSYISAMREEYKDKRGEWRVRVKASNGRIIYASTEGYHNRKDAINAARSAAEEIIQHYESNA